MEFEIVSVALIHAIRQKLGCALFVARHRRESSAFTRTRKLPFSSVMLLVLQKSLKSLQLRLHEFFEQLSQRCALAAATPGAWTQARAKLSHTAFIELNEEVLPAVLEAHGAGLRRWKTLRLLAIDSSLLRLPEEEEMWERFGGHEPSNQSGACGMRVPLGRLSVLYDVLNALGLETRVEPFATGEIEMAVAHLPRVGPGDLCLVDRGYAGYGFFAKVRATGGHFLGRCPRRSFRAVAELFARNEADLSVVVRLQAPAQAVQANRDLPLSLEVRLVTVRLPTGELEVLATSLLEEAEWPTADFGELYRQRWGIETFYGVLKGRLDLENFSGRTVESVLQDIHASVFLTNLETVLCVPVADALAKQGPGVEPHSEAGSRAEPEGRKYAVKINRAVSFHTIKSRLFDLLLSDIPVEETLARIQVLLRANPVTIRPERAVPRKPPSPLRSLHHQKRIRKIVF